MTVKTTRRQFLAILAALVVVRVAPAPQRPAPSAMEAGETAAQCGM